MSNRDYFIARAELANEKLMQEKAKRRNFEIPKNCFLFKRVASNGSISIVMVKVDNFQFKKQVIKQDVLKGIGVSICDLPDYSVLKYVIHEAEQWFKSHVFSKLESEFEAAKVKSRNYLDSTVMQAYEFRREVYEEYLSSPEWQEKRMECFSVHGNECMDCEATATDIHHQHYLSLCNEDPNKDLVPLCSDCHKLRHDRNDYYGRLLESRVAYISCCKNFLHKQYGWLAIESFSDCDQITGIPFIEFIPPNGKFKQRIVISSSDILEFSA